MSRITIDKTMFRILRFAYFAAGMSVGGAIMTFLLAGRCS